MMYFRGNMLKMRKILKCSNSVTLIRVHNCKTAEKKKKTIKITRQRT